MINIDTKQFVDHLLSQGTIFRKGEAPTNPEKLPTVIGFCGSCNYNMGSLAKPDEQFAQSVLLNDHYTTGCVGVLEFHTVLPSTEGVQQTVSS